MYLQGMAYLAMHVLCCLGTRGSSMHPDESALTVHLSSEYKVKFTDEKGDMVEEKTYRVDMRVRWDRDVLGRAVHMLGKEQGYVSAKKVETILRAMADQSTDTESAHVHNTGGAVEVLWNERKFGRAARTHGGRLQSNVDIEEVKSILYAMAYQSTDKVDILHVSDYMKRVAEWDGESHEIMWDRKIFEKTYNIMMGKKQEKVNASEMVKILHLMEHLKIEEKWEWACYDKLAIKTMEDYKETAEYAKNFVEEVKGRGTKIEGFSLYMQHLLRLLAEEHGMRLTADEEKKTLDLRCIHSKKYRRENRTGDWTLRVEVSEKYRRRTEVQEVAEGLIEVMNMTVEVDTEKLELGDIRMLERIISKSKEAELRIKSRRVKPGAIAHKMQSLKNNIIELDVSENKNQSDEDWKRVGEMTKLEKLKMWHCSVKPGTIAEHMQNLNLVELDVSKNHLSGEDWETIRKMTKLEKLKMWHCSVKPGTIAEHIQNLNLLELDVSSNKNLDDKDWKRVGEMTKLEKLKISACGIKPGTIAKYIQNLNLLELDVSSNKNLSNKDWKTVGKMKGLQKLKMWDCSIQAETIARHMQSLKKNIIELDVSWNRNISNKDWKTMGKMTKLERLDISDCNLQTGTIAKYMQNLNLVELDVSWNKNLSCEDWKTVVEKMTRIKRLDISNCQIDERLLYRYFYRRLGHCIEEMVL